MLVITRPGISRNCATRFIKRQEFYRQIFGCWSSEISQESEAKHWDTFSGGFLGDFGYFSGEILPGTNHWFVRFLKSIQVNLKSYFNQTSNGPEKWHRFGTSVAYESHGIWGYLCHGARQIHPAYRDHSGTERPAMRPDLMPKKVGNLQGSNWSSILKVSFFNIFFGGFYIVYNCIYMHVHNHVHAHTLDQQSSSPV